MYNRYILHLSLHFHLQKASRLNISQATNFRKESLFVHVNHCYLLASQFHKKYIIFCLSSNKSFLTTPLFSDPLRYTTIFHTAVTHLSAHFFLHIFDTPFYVLIYKAVTHLPTHLFTQLSHTCLEIYLRRCYIPYYCSFTQLSHTFLDTYSHTWSIHLFSLVDTDVTPLSSYLFIQGRCQTPCNSLVYPQLSHKCFHTNSQIYHWPVRFTPSFLCSYKKLLKHSAFPLP